ncbi:hypothetical protein [Streptomyces sp. NPDC021562]
MVRVEFVVVDGLEGEELGRRQLNAMRDVLFFLADEEQCVGQPEQGGA